jgi:hypothetical protein
LLENFPDTNKVGKLLERQLTLMPALHHFSKFTAKVEKKGVNTLGKKEFQQLQNCLPVILTKNRVNFLCCHSVYIF